MAVAPRDDDFGSPGIASSQLFFIGSGPFTFVTPGAGTLFLGVNDTFAINNSGSFTANVSVVPEPTSFALLALGIGVLMRRRKRGGVGPDCP